MEARSAELGVMKRDLHVPARPASPACKSPMDRNWLSLKSGRGIGSEFSVPVCNRHWLSLDITNGEACQGKGSDLADAACHAAGHPDSSCGVDQEVVEAKPEAAAKSTTMARPRFASPTDLCVSRREKEKGVAVAAPVVSSERGDDSSPPAFAVAEAESMRQRKAFTVDRGMQTPAAAPVVYCERGVGNGSPAPSTSPTTAFSDAERWCQRKAPTTACRAQTASTNIDGLAEIGVDVKGNESSDAERWCQRKAPTTACRAQTASTNVDGLGEIGVDVRGNESRSLGVDGDVDGGAVEDGEEDECVIIEQPPGKEWTGGGLSRRRMTSEEGKGHHLDGLVAENCRGTAVGDTQVEEAKRRGGDTADDDDDDDNVDDDEDDDEVVVLENGGPAATPILINLDSEDEEENGGSDDDEEPSCHDDVVEQPNTCASPSNCQSQCSCDLGDVSSISAATTAAGVGCDVDGGSCVGNGRERGENAGSKTKGTVVVSSSTAITVPKAEVCCSHCGRKKSSEEEEALSAPLERPSAVIEEEEKGLSQERIATEERGKGGGGGDEATACLIVEGVGEHQRVKTERSTSCQRQAELSRCHVNAGGNIEEGTLSPPLVAVKGITTNWEEGKKGQQGGEGSLLGAGMDDDASSAQRLDDNYECSAAAAVASAAAGVVDSVAGRGGGDATSDDGSVVEVQEVEERAMKLEGEKKDGSHVRHGEDAAERAGKGGGGGSGRKAALSDGGSEAVMGAPELTTSSSETGGRKVVGVLEKRGEDGGKKHGCCVMAAVDDRNDFSSNNAGTAGDGNAENECFPQAVDLEAKCSNDSKLRASSSFSASSPPSSSSSTDEDDKVGSVKQSSRRDICSPTAALPHPPASEGCAVLFVDSAKLQEEGEQHYVERTRRLDDHEVGTKGSCLGGKQKNGVILERLDKGQDVVEGEWANDRRNNSVESVAGRECRCAPGGLLVLNNRPNLRNSGWGNAVDKPIILDDDSDDDEEEEVKEKPVKPNTAFVSPEPCCVHSFRCLALPLAGDGGDRNGEERRERELDADVCRAPDKADERMERIAARRPGEASSRFASDPAAGVWEQEGGNESEEKRNKSKREESRMTSVCLNCQSRKESVAIIEEEGEARGGKRTRDDVCAAAPAVSREAASVGEQRREQSVTTEAKVQVGRSVCGHQDVAADSSRPLKKQKQDDDDVTDVDKKMTCPDLVIVAEEDCKAEGTVEGVAGWSRRDGGKLRTRWTTVADLPSQDYLGSSSGGAGRHAFIGDHSDGNGGQSRWDEQGRKFAGDVDGGSIWYGGQGQQQQQHVECLMPTNAPVRGGSSNKGLQQFKGEADVAGREGDTDDCMMRSDPKTKVMDTVEITELQRRVVSGGESCRREQEWSFWNSAEPLFQNVRRDRKDGGKAGSRSNCVMLPSSGFPVGCEQNLLRRWGMDIGEVVAAGSGGCGTVTGNCEKKGSREAMTSCFPPGKAGDVDKKAYQAVPAQEYNNGCGRTADSERGGASGNLSNGGCCPWAAVVGVGGIRQQQQQQEAVSFREGYECHRVPSLNMGGRAAVPVGVSAAAMATGGRTAAAVGVAELTIGGLGRGVPAAAMPRAKEPAQVILGGSQSARVAAGGDFMCVATRLRDPQVNSREQTLSRVVDDSASQGRCQNWEGNWVSNGLSNDRLDVLASVPINVAQGFRFGKVENLAEKRLPHPQGLTPWPCPLTSEGIGLTGGWKASQGQVGNVGGGVVPGRPQLAVGVAAQQPRCMAKQDQVVREDRAEEWTMNRVAPRVKLEVVDDCVGRHSNYSFFPNLSSTPSLLTPNGVDVRGTALRCAGRGERCNHDCGCGLGKGDTNKGGGQLAGKKADCLGGGLIAGHGEDRKGAMRIGGSSPVMPVGLVTHPALQTLVCPAVSPAVCARPAGEVTSACNIAVSSAEKRKVKEEHEVEHHGVDGVKRQRISEEGNGARRGSEGAAQPGASWMGPAPLQRQVPSCCAAAVTPGVRAEAKQQCPDTGNNASGSCSAGEDDEGREGAAEEDPGRNSGGPVRLPAGGEQQQEKPEMTGHVAAASGMEMPDDFLLCREVKVDGETDVFGDDFISGPDDLEQVRRMALAGAPWSTSLGTTVGAVAQEQLGIRPAMMVTAGKELTTRRWAPDLPRSAGDYLDDEQLDENDEEEELREDLSGLMDNSCPLQSVRTAEVLEGLGGSKEGQLPTSKDCSAAAGQIGEHQRMRERCAGAESAARSGKVGGVCHSRGGEACGHAEAVAGHAVGSSEQLNGREGRVAEGGSGGGLQGNQRAPLCPPHMDRMAFLSSVIQNQCGTGIEEQPTSLFVMRVSYILTLGLEQLRENAPCMRCSVMCPSGVKKEWETVERSHLIYHWLARELDIYNERLEFLSRKDKVKYQKVQVRSKVVQIMGREGVRINREKAVGHVPGIGVGSKFADRAEMTVLGLHSQMQAGIDYMSSKDSVVGEVVATAIVISPGYYEDDVDVGDRIVYTGSGCNAKSMTTKQKRNLVAANAEHISGYLTDGKTLVDPVSINQRGHQRLSGGNLALSNSWKYGLPVRVIRGTREGGNQFYTYAGLFLVSRCWYEMGRSGFSVWRFELLLIDESSLQRRPTAGAVPPGGLSAAAVPRVVSPSTAPASSAPEGSSLQSATLPTATAAAATTPVAAGSAEGGGEKSLAEGEKSSAAGPAVDLSGVVRQNIHVRLVGKPELQAAARAVPQSTTSMSPIAEASAIPSAALHTATVLPAGAPSVALHTATVLPTGAPMAGGWTDGGGEKCLAERGTSLAARAAANLAWVVKPKIHVPVVVKAEPQEDCDCIFRNCHHQFGLQAHHLHPMGPMASVQVAVGSTVDSCRKTSAAGSAEADPREGVRAGIPVPQVKSDAREGIRAGIPVPQVKSEPVDDGGCVFSGHHQCALDVAHPPPPPVQRGASTSSVYWSVPSPSGTQTPSYVYAGISSPPDGPESTVVCS